MSPEEEVLQLKVIVQEQKDFIAELQKLRALYVSEIRMWQEEVDALGGAPVSKKEIDILQHALGISDIRREPFRNYYCSYSGDPIMNLMIHKGLMSAANKINDGRDQYFIVTERGKEIAVANLPKPPSRDRKRYLDFLKFSDAYCDVTFKEFLKKKLYTEEGKKAFFGEY